MSPATYHGVVRGGIVLLDNGSPLADGTEVNVTPVVNPVGSPVRLMEALAASPPVPKEWTDELERAINPAASPLPPPKSTLGELVALMQSDPILGDDAERFAEDLRAIRAQFPSEANPWE